MCATFQWNEIAWRTLNDGSSKTVVMGGGWVFVHVDARAHTHIHIHTHTYTLEFD